MIMTKILNDIEVIVKLRVLTIAHHQVNYIIVCVYTCMHYNDYLADKVLTLGVLERDSLEDKTLVVDQDKRHTGK